MPTAAHELARAFDFAARESLSRKQTRKLLRCMELYLTTHLPENGIGPVISARREALQILLSEERQAARKQA